MITKKETKSIQAAAARVSAEISDLASHGKYGAGMATEGYSGGYRDALHDVLLLLQSGCTPDRRGYWECLP